jgi:quinone-modifying oxidoreductase, subunit QmoB
MTQNSQAEMEKITMATDVLVIGGGVAALKSASEIAGLGYRVILVEKDETLGLAKEMQPLPGLTDKDRAIISDLMEGVGADKMVEILTGTVLAGAAGVPGDFKVWLSRTGEILERRVGAVVVAADYNVEPLNQAYGLTLSECVVTQSELEKTLENGSDTLAGKSIAFVSGLAQNGTPLSMERVFRSVLALSKIKGCTTFIYTDDLKVAGDHLEQLYLEGRNSGANYFKLSEMPIIEQVEKNLTISFNDPVLRQPVKMTPDMIVVEEAMGVDEITPGLAEVLKIDTGSQGFLQTENVHRFPVNSNREGIFVAGASRMVQSLSRAFADAENVALRIRDLLGDGTKMVPLHQAVVDSGKCTFCLTCYRCCPHGAIYWDADNKPVISQLACQGCGICASECPMDAIQIGDYSDAHMIEKIGDGLAEKSEDPTILAFCCLNSALEAGEMADSFKLKIPAGLKMIKVPCAGKVDTDYIMKAFAKGADGVIVMACHTGNCKSERGNTFAGWRVNDAQRMLEEVGLGKERLLFATVAANMGADFSSIVMDMEERIKELGTSPLNR